MTLQELEMLVIHLVRIKIKIFFMRLTLSKNEQILAYLDMKEDRVALFIPTHRKAKKQT